MTASLLAGFSDKRVLLVGDTILDVFTYGTAMGLSAETPTIVSRKKETKLTLGGAAFTCRNLLALGASVDFMTLVGRDEETVHVRSFVAPKLRMLAVEDEAKPTTVKHRFWVDGYKLFQLDSRDDRPISDRLADEALGRIVGGLSGYDAIVISDYRHGFLTPYFADKLVTMIRQAQKPYYLDSQVSQSRANHTQYQPDAIMCLNLKEARCFDAGFSPSHDASSFAKLAAALNTQSIVVKMGEKGAFLYRHGRVLSAPAIKVDVVDTIGAGDAFLAAFCLAGIDAEQQALTVANAWAGLSVQIRGTQPPQRAALHEILNLPA